jgi:hypothetical protein
MKMTLESTPKMVMVREVGAKDGVECRVWEGETARGTRVTALITRIDVQDGSEFEVVPFEVRTIKRRRNPGRKAEIVAPAADSTSTADSRAPQPQKEGQK